MNEWLVWGWYWINIGSIWNTQFEKSIWSGNCVFKVCRCKGKVTQRRVGCGSGSDDCLSCNEASWQRIIQASAQGAPHQAW